jgi:hypothetical protein
VTVLVAGACTAGPDAGDRPDSGGGVRSSSAIRPGAGGPSPVLTSGRPDGWRVCTNRHLRYSIGYPGTWHTRRFTDEETCALFHPVRFVIPPNGDYPPTALNVRRIARPPTRPSDPTLVRTVRWEPTTVKGRAAVRFEEEATGLGPEERGTMRYGYVADLGGRAFAVYTVARPGDPDYTAWKAVVDQAVWTLSAT